METKTTKFHPILFSTPMVQAIQEKKKYQTRRTKGLESINENPDAWKHVGIATFANIPVQKNDFRIYQCFEDKATGKQELVKCPYELDDVLWVRETFEYFESTYNPNGTTDDKNSSVKIQFVADNKISNEISVTKIQALKALVKIEKGKLEKPIYNPSIFMPKQACRTFLKIKSIRVERLQDISEGDSIAEGAKDRLKHSDLKVLDGLKDWVIPSPFLQHQFGFLAIWCTINGCDSWIKNPFVWVYEFEKIEKPLDFAP